MGKLYVFVILRSIHIWLVLASSRSSAATVIPTERQTANRKVYNELGEV